MGLQDLLTEVVLTTFHIPVAVCRVNRNQKKQARRTFLVEDFTGNFHTFVNDDVFAFSYSL